MSSIEYLNDGDRFVAAIDHGGGGFFVRRGMLPQDGDWRFVIPGSLEWDAIHQDIYYAHHDLDSCPLELSASLPPLPECPPFKPLKWEENFLPCDSLPVSDFPNIAAFVSSSPEAQARFWFILAEDRYETLFGDGEFYYFLGHVYGSGWDASEFVRLENEEEAKNEKRFKDTVIGSMYTVKSFLVAIRNGELLPLDFLPLQHEHCPIENVLKRIEETLSSNGTLLWGTPNK